MAVDEVDRYITYEGRLASFQKTAKKRGSTASGRAKALAWPHKQIAPASLAKAGFYFDPQPASPDNVTCFLCGKGLDGWEAGDDPLLEHLKHASHCGWAIVSAIQAEVGNYAHLDPISPNMTEARKATFAGIWPHEVKKGWKCKTKQLVDAGWKYTPTAESDDMATCAYCELALDGWEPSDKPYDEHYSRSPGCAFFALVKQFEGTRKTGRAKATRGSKASRLSVQSVATVASDTTSVGDTTAVGDDSVVTTASTMTQGGRTTKSKRGAAAKGSRSRARKEPAEPEDANEDQAAPPRKPAKPARGRKRGSEAVDASVSLPDAPVSKKRATRARRSTVTNASTVVADDGDPGDAPAPAHKALGRRKNAGSDVKTSRQPSAFSTVSTASMASLRAPADEFPDDEEIERQLEADLARESDDDDVEAQHVESDVEDGHREQAAPQASGNYAMFDPALASVDDAVVEDELLELQAEMQVDEPERPKVAPKSPEVAAPETSEHAESDRAEAASPPQEEGAPLAEAPRQGVVEEPHNGPAGSADSNSGQPQAAKRGHGRPSKASLASQNSAGSEEPSVAKRGRGRPPKALVSRDSSSSVQLVDSAEQPVKGRRGRPSKASLASRASVTDNESNAAEAPAKRSRGRPPKKSGEAGEGPGLQRVSTAAKTQTDAVDVADAPRAVEAVQLDQEHKGPSVGRRQSESGPPQRVAEPRSTPTKVISPAPSAKQAALSPSQSPQPSDAENQPPSSKPASSTMAKRVVLAPVTATPSRGSPVKPNVLAGLESSTPWTAVNLEAVLGSPRSGADKENLVDRLLKKARELTSPEKGMTVEEWINFNAAEAEKKLKYECETMVSKFEREGTRAMHVLEGLSAE